MSAAKVMDIRQLGSVPNSLASERVILSSLMGYGLSVMEACHRLRAEMFYTDAHRIVFSALIEMISEGKTPDEFSLAEHLGKTRLASIGGIPFLIDLSDGLNRVKEPTQYVGIVVEKWKLRQGMRICERYGAQFAQEEPSDSTLSLMQSEVFDALQERAASRDANIAALTVPALESTLDYTRSAMGLSYGHTKLDEFTMGMQDGEVTIVGARSGVGKSSLMIQSVYGNAMQGKSCDIYSLEMDDLTVQQRLWALDSHLPFNAIRRKMLKDSERRALKEAAYRVAELPIRIYSDGDMSLAQIAATARLNARRNGMKLMAVDYAQRVNADGSDEKTKVSAVSRTLTNLVKSERIHLMLLSQLRKMPVEQYNRPPHISDLAETRQMENDAHTCVLLHRGWDEEAARISMQGEIIVPKQRNGATGAMQATFNKDSLGFE